MKLYPNVNQNPLSNLSVGIDNPQSTNLLPFFYKDKFQLNVYLHDGNGQFPTEYNEALVKVALGFKLPREIIISESYQLLANETIANFTIDLDTNEVNDITENKLSTNITLEIELTKGSITKTITQSDLLIRNQFLNVDVVADVVPFNPSQVLAILGVVPDAPSDVVSNTTPLAPSNVVSASGETEPLAPSDVVADYETEPDAPSDVDSQLLILPTAVDWVVAQKGAEPVTDVTASLLTANGPTDVTATNLSTIAPRMAIMSAQDIGTIPLEPTDLVADVTPLQPYQIFTDRSPSNISDLIAYDYANRPAGWFGGQPSNVRAIELFKAGGDDGSGKPTEIYAVKSNNRLPNEPEQYFGKAITDIGAEVLTPSNPSEVSSYYDPFSVDQAIDTIDPFTKVICYWCQDIGISEEARASSEATVGFLQYLRSPLGTHLQQVIPMNGKTYLQQANTGNMNEDEIIFIHAHDAITLEYYAGDVLGYHEPIWDEPTETDLRSAKFDEDFNAYKEFYNAKIASGKKHNVYILAHQPWNDYRNPNYNAGRAFKSHLAKCVYHDSDRLADYGCYAKILPYNWTWANQSYYTNLTHVGWRNISEWQTQLMQVPQYSTDMEMSYTADPSQQGYWQFDLSESNWIGLPATWDWTKLSNVNRTTGSFRTEYSSDGTDAGYITGYSHVYPRDKMTVTPQVGHPNHYILIGVQNIWFRTKIVSSDPNYADVVGPWVQGNPRLPFAPNENFIQASLV